MRRLVRALGTLMIVSGLGVLAWTLLVWQWRDPFTNLYTAYNQDRLGSRYDERAARFRPLHPSAGRSLAASRKEVALEARRYRRASQRGEPIARLRIRRLDLNMIVVNGTDSATLKKGPGRDRRTFMPGQGQLVYIAGHRTTYAAPFSRIDDLRPGDRVTIQLPYATFVYRVARHVIVPADDIDRLNSRGREELALQACHPRFFATQRYIVYAKPVRVTPRGGVAYSLADEAAAAGA